MRWYVYFLAMLVFGCSGGAHSGNDLRLATQECVRSTEAWLAKTDDIGKLKTAITTVNRTKDSFKDDTVAKGQRLYADIELLSGALNMAQMGLEVGQLPTRPSSLSEVPAADSIRIVVSKLKADLMPSSSTPTP